MAGTVGPRRAAMSAENRAARDHTISLLTMFLGLPASFVLASLWGLLVGTEDVGGDPRVTGWRAVLYALPGTVLVLGVAITSVWFAARALRGGAYDAKVGVWLTSGGLFVVVWILGMGAVNAVVQPKSPGLHWVVRLVAAVSGVAAYVFAQRGGIKKQPS